MKFERTATLALSLAITAFPVLAQQSTTQSQQSTTTTTTTSSDTPQGRVVGPESAHQLKKQQRADKKQAQADEAERKLAKSDKMHKAEKKQSQADAAADRANNPYR
ncbi:MAG TPA: hypothetical protein VIJ65_09655 [Acidobacteriaceae bacterium]